MHGFFFFLQWFAGGCCEGAARVQDATIRCISNFILVTTAALRQLSLYQCLFQLTGLTATTTTTLKRGSFAQKLSCGINVFIIIFPIILRSCVTFHLV